MRPNGKNKRPNVSNRQKYAPKRQKYAPKREQPAKIRAQTAKKKAPIQPHSAMQIHELLKKITRLRGIKPGTSWLGLQRAYQSSCESLLDRQYPQLYLIRANRKKYPLINHSLYAKSCPKRLSLPV